jgi:hypothetical protein
MSRFQFLVLACSTIIVLCIGLILLPQGLEGATTDDNSLTTAELAQAGVEQDPERKLTADDRVEVALPADPADADSDLDVAVVEAERFLTGTVLDQNYDPVADAWVISDREAEPVHTAEDGTFSIPLQGPFSADEGRGIHAWKEGLSMSHKYVRQLEGTLLVLKPDGGIEFQILDQDSKLPLVGAKVEMQVDVESERGGGFFELRRSATVPAELGESDANGMVQIPDPEVSRNYSLEISLEGYDNRTVNQWTLRYQKKVYMARPKQTRMRFTRADGTPHAGARLCFNWERVIVTMDDGGWGDLPTSARWGFWGVQLIDENEKWVFDQIDADQIADGITLTTAHEPRSGKLFVEGGEKANNFEVASSGSWNGWGEEYLPDPSWNDEDLDWQPIQENGEFHVKQGWQSEKTYLHVRRAGSKGVLLSQQVNGPGPHQLSLASAAQVTLIVECPSPEVLEGATLKVDGRRTDHEITKPLSEGKLELRLPVDKFKVELMLAGMAYAFPLGSCEVNGQDMEQTFYFEGLRLLKGSVSADGQGVFPCNVRIRSSDGFYARLDTDPQGKWELKGAPKKNLTVEYYPENSWLTPVDRPRYELPMGLDQLNTELEVGYLLLSPGDLTDGELKKLRVNRRPLPGRETYGKRSYNRYSRPKDLDFSNGPIEVALGPSLVNFSVNGLSLAATEIEVDAGQTRTFVLQSIATTSLCIRLRNFDAQLWGSWGVTPIHVPLMQDYPSFKVMDIGGNTQAGQIGSAKHLLPGRWKVWVRAPLWYWDDWGNGQIGKGRVEFEIDVAGEWQDIWLRTGEDQKLIREE